jgi:competence protein ComEC
MSLIIGLTAASLLLALASGLHYWGQLKESGQQLESLQVIEFGARLIGDPSQGAYSSQSTARISAKNIQTVSVRLFWPAGEEPAALGSRIKAKAKLRPLQEHQEFLFQKGIAASYVLETVDQRGFPADPYGVLGKFRETNTKALSDLGTDGGLLLRGVLLGDSNELYASDTGLAFRMTGLMHLVAVSGSHLAVIAAMLTWLLKRLGLRRLPQLAILAGILVAYVMLTAFQPSAIRATIMVVVVQAAGLSNRRAHAPSALGLAALLMILIHPPTAFSLGFWLSVFAVASLTLFLPLIRGWLSGSIDTVGEFARSLLNRQWGAIGFWQGTAGYRQGKSWHQQLAIGNQQDTGGHRQAASVLQQGVATPQTSRQKNSSSRAAAVGRSLLDPLAMTLCAQLGTAPLTLPIFAACPLVSPLANLLAAPLVTLQLLVGLPTLIIGSVFPSIRGLIVRFLGAIADLTCRLTEILADLPLACLPFSSALIPSLIWSLAIAALLYMLWPQFSRRTLPIPALAIALLIGFGLIQPLLPAKPELVVMDVGQGDAILIRDGRKSILLDTGPNETALLKALGRNQVVDLDAVMLSHLDADHSAALPILRTVQPEQVLLPAGLFEHQSTDAVIQKAATLCQGRQPRGLLSGDRLILGPRLTLTVLLPDTEVSESSNENCLVCALEYDADADGRSEARILLTGDAESSALQQLSEAEVEGGFQVIKVGHHGSKGAISGEQLKSWGCQAALISVGENNQFGHPTPETLEALTTNGVQVLRTDLDGDIHLNFKQGKIELSCATIEQFNE